MRPKGRGTVWHDSERMCIYCTGRSGRARGNELVTCGYEAHTNSDPIMRAHYSWPQPRLTPNSHYQPDCILQGNITACSFDHWKYDRSLCVIVGRVRKNCEKRLLASSCLSACLSDRLTAWINSAPIGRISMKF